MKRFIFVLGILIWLSGSVSAFCLFDWECGSLHDCKNNQCVLKQEVKDIILYIIIILFLLILSGIIIGWATSQEHYKKEKEKKRVEDLEKKLEDLEKIKESDKKSKYCTQCGNKLSPEDKFCRGCGVKV